MPPVSERQRAWAHANKDKPGKEGAAAREFAASDPGGTLPTRVKDGKPVRKADRRYAKKPKP
jgi:hypothetical protein